MVNLLEDPTPIILAGIAIEAVLGILLLRSGRGVFLVAMGVVALLALLGVAVEWLVVTDTEQVENLIEAGRVATEKNDVNAALALVDPAAAEVVGQVRRGFQEVKFEEVKVRGLTIAVNHGTQPSTAQANFTVLATFDARHGNVPYRNVLGTAMAKLQRFGDRWLVTDLRRTQAGVGGQPLYPQGAGRP
jgi:hypothetical protein